MRRKSHKGIIIAIIIIIIGIVATVIVLKNKKTAEENKTIVEKYDIIEENGRKINTSNTLAQEKIIAGLKVTRAVLSCNEGLSTLLLDVENTGTETVEEKIVSIEVIDDEQNVLATLKCAILKTEPGQTRELNMNITEDIAGAYDYRIVE